ncbi:hypothetical protein B0H66DRAFT_380774 [Apodospora peruviana]|uniref:Uncharacterized protein n=1 Tax=Apodospora peruviana TaxID=516989 RepID=A0AAE0HUG0_9PEZI|nr:hypothetical protein B0H66DRAFT_380774 [Apodospora peruviana]
MGAAMSRCTNRGSTSRNSTSATHHGFAEISQRILDRQPNWLVPPSKWISDTSSHHHHTQRYRTPTPYPKDDRKKLEEVIHIPEKAAILESDCCYSPVVKHLEGAPLQKSSTHIQLPPQAAAAVTITWESHPRVNRFERVS